MSSEGTSALGARLVEMDRLLHDVQVELAPERDPPPPLVGESEPPSAAPRADPPPSRPPAVHEPQIQALSELSVRLLASTRELLAGYERVLVRPAAPRRAVRPPPDSPEVTLSAAPFAGLEALREFEQAVARLPGVREVAVRGYEGTDRAIIEVRLDQTNP